MRALFTMAGYPALGFFLPARLLLDVDVVSRFLIDPELFANQSKGKATVAHTHDLDVSIEFN